MDLNPVPWNDVALADQSSTLVNTVKTWQVQVPVIKIQITSILEKFFLPCVDLNNFLNFKYKIVPKPQYWKNSSFHV
jgi:hypothetical protein